MALTIQEARGTRFVGPKVPCSHRIVLRYAARRISLKKFAFTSPKEKYLINLLLPVLEAGVWQGLFLPLP